MKRCLILCMVCLATTDLFAAEPAPNTKLQTPALPASIEKREVVIWSDGTRMVGDLYQPKDRNENQRLPAIIYCNGTGGRRQGAARFAIAAAGAGFVALAFDYRGWGESDSLLMSLEKQPKLDAKGEMTVAVRALRWQMNYTDQTQDIRAAIGFLAGEPTVDPERIGLLGTSYGGGLVIWMGGNDPRIKCIAAQVPGMGGVRTPAASKRAYELLTQQARGEIEPVPYETGKLGGNLATYDYMRANPAKNIGFSAVEAAQKIKAPTLIIDAEKDELLDIRQNGGLVAEILKQRGIPSKYHIINGITHYGVYREAFVQTTDLELEWFKEQLKVQGSPKGADLKK